MTEAVSTSVDPDLSPTGDIAGSPTGEHEPASGTDAPDGPETFDSAYVERLREEAAGHRVKAKRAEALSAALVTAQAAATGSLADATDLPYDDDLLDDVGVPDPDKVLAAVDDLIARKPHLAARRPRGDVGQGARPEVEEIGLASLLRRGV